MGRFFAGAVIMGLPPGFQVGRQVVLASQRMGSIMEAMAPVEVVEVDGGELVGGLMVVLVQADSWRRCER